MAYSSSRIWYGLEGYQHGTLYTPAGTAPTGGWPIVVYRTGGGWRGADVADLESRYWWAYGLNSGSSSYQEKAMVLAINTASVGYNQRKATGLTSWATGATYSLGDFIYQAVPSTPPNTGRYWSCIDGHTASAAGAGAGLNQPGIGDDWALYWREVGPNETGQHQVSSLGETTPGGLDEMVRNCQEAICWVRRQGVARAAGDTTAINVNPSKVVLAGASAGGQMAGCAAYAEPLAWARSNVPEAAARSVPYITSTPNALIMSITPVDLTYHTTYSLLLGLYGEDATDAAWQAREDGIKQAMSPLWVLKRTGIAVPTYLDFAGTGPYSTTYANLTGAPYHHADNGWLMLHYLADARPSGLGRTDCRFATNVVTSTDLFSWSAATGSGTKIGVGAGSPHVTTTLEYADHILGWLDDLIGIL